MLGTISPFSAPRSCLWLWTWWVCTWSTATTTWFLCCKILEGCNRGGTCTFVHGWMFQVVSKDHFVKQSLHHWVAQQAGFWWEMHLTSGKKQSEPSTSTTFGLQNVCSFPGCFFVRITSSVYFQHFNFWWSRLPVHEADAKKVFPGSSARNFLLRMTSNWDLNRGHCNHLML